MAMLYLRNKPIGAISSGASGGGHTIENPSGTDMTQRSNLQFTDAEVADDSTNDRTEISIVRKVTQEEFDELTPEEQNRGVIVITDANPVYVPSDNAVSVTADGVKTYSQLLDELYALIDMNKVGRNTVLKIDVGAVFYGSLAVNIVSTGVLLFYNVNSSSLNFSNSVNVKLTSTGSIYQGCRAQGSSPYNVFSDYSSEIPASGSTFTLYYNIVASGQGMETSAQDVSFDPTTSGLTSTDVQDAIDEVAVKTVTETITSNSFHWIVFPQGRKVLNAVITGSYNTFFLYYESSNNRYITKWFVNYNSSTFSPTEVTASTSYSITYQYI